MLIDQTNLPPYSLCPVKLHPLIITFGRTWQTGLHIAFSRSRVTFFTLGWPDKNNRLKDCFVVTFLFAGHNEDEGHLFYEVTIFDKCI